MDGEKSKKSKEPEKIKVKFDPARQVGTLDGNYFDPLGISQIGDKRGFLRRRAVEIKHGRVAMVALSGLAFQHFVHVPVNMWETQVKLAPYGIGATSNFYGITGFVCFATFGLSIGFLELYVLAPKEGKYPGDFGDPAGFGQYTEEMRTAELQNGRAAMIGIAACFLAEFLTGRDIIEQIGAPFELLFPEAPPAPPVVEEGGVASIIPLTSG